MKWTTDEIAVCIYTALIGTYFAWYFTTDWFSFFCVAILATCIGIAIYAVVRGFVSWIVAAREEGFEFNPLARLGVRGTKPYNEAYINLFAAVRQLEESDDVQYFNYRKVREVAGYGETADRKNYEMLACLHAWTDIKPLLLPYSKDDASFTLYVGFIKEA